MLTILINLIYYEIMISKTVQNKLLKLYRVQQLGSGSKIPFVFSIKELILNDKL